MPTRIDFHVAGHPADDPAELDPVEKTHRLGQGFGINLRSQAIDHRLPDLQCVALAKVKEAVGRDREQTIAGDAKHQMPSKLAAP